MKKAYAGDIIQVTNPEPNATYKIGDLFEVDFRQSDLGACDDTFLLTTTEEAISDEEYILIKKVNARHFREDITVQYLNKSNEELIALFKIEQEGEQAFNQFMALVRTNLSN